MVQLAPRNPRACSTSSVSGVFKVLPFTFCLISRTVPGCFELRKSFSARTRRVERLRFSCFYDIHLCIYLDLPYIVTKGLDKIARKFLLYLSQKGQAIFK